MGGAGAEGGGSGAGVDAVGRWGVVGEDLTCLAVSVVPQPPSRVPTATKTTNGRTRGILGVAGPEGGKG